MSDLSSDVEKITPDRETTPSSMAVSPLSSSPVSSHSNDVSLPEDSKLSVVDVSLPEDSKLSVVDVSLPEDSKLSVVDVSLPEDSKLSVLPLPLTPQTPLTPKVGRKKLTDEERKLRREQKQKLKEEEEKQAAAERKEAALNQMRYLLSVCEKYSEVYKKIVNDQKSLKEKNSIEAIKEEDIEREIKTKSKKNQDYDITNHLKYFENGKLRPYQLEGVTWLYMLYANASNGILADEMGLGKTIQIIALICVLMEKQTPGPYLIVAPLSTIPNWQSEFQRFAPKIPVVTICGSQEQRRESIQRIKMRYKVGQMETRPVVLCTYQTPTLEYQALDKFKWRYIIVDEGHRIKNHNSQLAQALRNLKSESRLLLTGTPIQNSIDELWSLLNFLLPTFFTNMSTFTELFLLQDMQDENKILQEEQSNNIVSKIHKVLAPFMLRRVKKDVLDEMVPKKEVVVYCPLSDLQIKLYDFVIEKNINGLKNYSSDDIIDVNQPTPKRKCTLKAKNYVIPDEDDLDFDDLIIDESDLKVNKSELKKFNEILTRVTMLSPLVMFRKIVNHPYLVHFPLDPNSEKKQLLIDENLVQSSGKLIVLDTLLPELRRRGHKVLLFSVLCMGLDLIEDYLIMRDIKYRRLDGTLSLEARAEQIKDFNEDPEVFIFLLSTRAGGLGLNLTAADTVIFFDRDWNPQMDIQAQDRCHRIGQKKPVVIYSLVAKNTVDEAVINRGKMKRVLEKVVISDGKFKTISQDDKARTEDMLLELRKALKAPTEDDMYIFSNKMELNKLLDRSDLWKQLEENKLLEEFKKEANEKENKSKSSGRKRKSTK